MLVGMAAQEAQAGRTVSEDLEPEPEPEMVVEPEDTLQILAGVELDGSPTR
eukprot:COSAG04_NODE_6331_length_1355_cov_1.750000_1_plen_50_part_10